MKFAKIINLQEGGILLAKISYDQSNETTDASIENATEKEILYRFSNEEAADIWLNEVTEASVLDELGEAQFYQFTHSKNVFCKLFNIDEEHQYLMVKNEGEEEYEIIDRISIKGTTISATIGYNFEHTRDEDFEKFNMEKVKSIYESRKRMLGV